MILKLSERVLMIMIAERRLSALVSRRSTRSIATEAPICDP